MTHDSVSAADATTLSWMLRHSLTKAYWCLDPFAHQQEDGVCFTFICKYRLYVHLIGETYFLPRTQPSREYGNFRF